MSTPKSGQNQKHPNSFYPAFDLLLARLLAAEQALGVSEAAFEHALESQDQWLARIPEGELPGMMADICDSSTPGYVKHIPSLRWPYREIDYLLRAVRVLRTQSCLWAIARAFEAFREFVESIEGGFPDTADHSAGQGPEPKKSTVGRKKLRFTQALKRIREAAPSLVACEKSNARKIQLQQWVCVAAEVRHAVAHNEGVLREAVYERFRTSGLEKHFPGELEAGTGYVLKPTLEIASKAIRTFREYGVAIYKAVSDAQGLPAKLVGQDGEITTWRR